MVIEDNLIAASTVLTHKYLHGSPIASNVTLISAAKSRSVFRLPGACAFGRKK